MWCVHGRRNAEHLEYGVGFAVVDIGLFVDGVVSPAAGQRRWHRQYLSTDAAHRQLSITRTISLSAGAHTFEWRRRRRAGWQRRERVVGELSAAARAAHVMFVKH